MDDYFFELGDRIDDGSNYRVMEVLSRLEHQDFEEACLLLGNDSHSINAIEEFTAE